MFPLLNLNSECSKGKQKFYDFPRNYGWKRFRIILKFNHEDTLIQLPAPKNPLGVQ